MTINLTSQNWLTSLGGLLGGIPAIIIGSGYPLTPRQTQIIAIIGGVGILITGLAAKDSSTHSTMAQVQTSTVKADAAIAKQ